MKGRVVYKYSVNRDLKKIDHQHRIRIMNMIEGKLADNPNEGKQLKGTYNELYSLRVGDYRVLYTMILDGVLILKIAHRKEVYRF